MADYPQVGDKFDSLPEFKLALHRAAQPRGVRLTVKRAEPTVYSLVCNGQGHRIPCTMTFLAHFIDRCWVVRTATLEQSHSFTTDSKLIAAEKSAAAIEKLEVELGAQRRSLSQAEDGHSAYSDSLDLSSTDEGNPGQIVPLEQPLSQAHRFPNATSVAHEIAELIAEKGGILPLPPASMSFPTSRELFIYLHASAKQHDFHVYRASAAGPDVRLRCRLGHTQVSHRPLCQARYHIAQGDDGSWRRIDDTVTKHTHPVLDDFGRVIPSAMGARNEVPEPCQESEPSKKRSRLSDPSTSIPTHFAPYSRLLPSTYVARPTATTRPNHLKPSLSAIPRFSPSASASATHPPASPKIAIPPPPSLDSSFLLTLSSFLASLSPRLSSLASPLVREGGIDSLERVMLFLSLSDDTRDLFLKEVEGLGLLERHLLKKELKRVRDRGWVVERGGAGAGAAGRTAMGSPNPDAEVVGVGAVCVQGALTARIAKKEL